MNECPYMLQHRCNPDTEDKIRKIVRLIKSANSIHNYSLAFSGGKDSVVMSYLTKEAGCQVPHVYNMTTIDPPGTIAFCKKNHCQILRPKHTFLQLVEKKGLPTQFIRFCCSELKERYISEYLMIGVRAAESVRRQKRYCTFEQVRNYSKKLQTLQLLPIVFLTDDDIEYIVKTRSLECHPLYYNNDGNFCVNRRLGCIGCPLQGDRGKSDFKQYPKLLVSIMKRLIIYHQNHGRTAKDAYEQAVYQLFYSNHGHAKFIAAYRGLFANDAKAFMESYFNISMP